MSNYLRDFVFILVPLFALFLLNSSFGKRKSWLFIYLTSLWIIIPWIIFTTYNGELTNYYFNLPRNIGFVMIAFVFVFLYELKNIFTKLIVFCLMLLFAGYNLYLFNNEPGGNYLGMENGVKVTVAAHQKIRFKDRDPDYYTFFIYTKYRH